MKIKPTLVGLSGKLGSTLNRVIIKTRNAPSYHENLPNRILNRFLKLNSVENKMQLESESSSRKMPNLDPSRIFSNFLNRRLRYSYLLLRRNVFFLAVGVL